MLDIFKSQMEVEQKHPIERQKMQESYLRISRKEALSHTLDGRVNS